MTTIHHVQFKFAMPRKLSPGIAVLGTQGDRGASPSALTRKAQVPTQVSSKV